MNPSDQELLTRMRAGDAAADAEFDDRYRDAIVRFARVQLHAEAAAEDVAQETFSRLLSDRAPLESPRPWLYKTARNLCVDRLRRQQVSPTHRGRMATGFDAPAESCGPATRVARDEGRQRVQAAILALPEEYRTVLLLRHVDDLSREEIAEILEISDAAVKGRLARGVGLLRESLRKLSGTLG